MRSGRPAATVAAYFLATAIGAGAFPGAALTQQPEAAGSFVPEVFAGSEAERYLRYLQQAGLVRDYPWSSRAFSPRELDRLVPSDSAHPWDHRYARQAETVGPLSISVIQPATVIRFNSSFPYGSNDGAVWAGRGLTSALQLGFQARWGPLSLTVAPLAFRAENGDFDIAPTGRPGPAGFGDPEFGGVDRPQRFGDSPYSRIDPGQSTLRVDLPFITAGASTANMTWGPAAEYPLILGNNAAGFPHLFVGSSEPLNLYLVKLHAKVMWGTLYQSEFSSVTGPAHYTSRGEPGTVRYTTGLVAVLQPRGITGLEVGLARFFHSIWPRSGIPSSYITKSFQDFLKLNLKPDRIADPRFQEGIDDRGVSDNQLASAFARWVLPRSGFELFAEYGRDDHGVDFRDLAQEPDHSRFYAVGASKVIKRTATSLTAARAEIINFQLPQIDRYRNQGEIYVHGLIRQGHTYRGQLLGADVGVGAAAGSTVGVDRYMTDGRWSASWVRTVRREIGYFPVLGVREARSIDVMHALGFEMTRFLRGFDVTGGVTLVRELNRDFREDATNLNAIAGVRYILR